MVYRGEIVLSPQQMRAAIESLPYENAKITAVAIGKLTGQDFYTRLEKAVRIQEARLIEAQVISTEEN